MANSSNKYCKCIHTLKYHYQKINGKEYHTCTCCSCSSFVEDTSPPVPAQLVKALDRYMKPSIDTYEKGLVEQGRSEEEILRMYHNLQIYRTIFSYWISFKKHYK